jgi:hypothetical protein
VAIGELATRDFIRSELGRVTADVADDAEKRDKKARKKRDAVG